MMKRVNIAIDPEVHKKAKVIAVLREVNLNDYFELAIERALKKEGIKIK